MTTSKIVQTQLEFREIAPHERHPLIFGTSAGLRHGKALLLVDDHDSKALFYQFQAESPGQFTGDDLDTGPNVWGVRIGRTGTARECCAE